MALDMNKYRQNSVFYNNTSQGITQSDVLLNQSISQFDAYQATTPNSYLVIINDNTTPILATFVDASENGSKTDIKDMFTSLQNVVELGDIITWADKKYLCIHNYVKGIENFNKVLIQQCNYPLQIAYFKSDGTPDVYIADSIVSTQKDNIKQFRQPFDSNDGSTCVIVPNNPIIFSKKKLDAIWLYDTSWKIVGIDFSDSNYYTKKGVIKWTVTENMIDVDYDNAELGISDYYKVFPKATATPIITNQPLGLISSGSNALFRNINITASKITDGSKVIFVFEGKNISCTLSPISNNECALNIGGENGILYVKAYLESDNTIFETIRFNVG